MTKPATVNFVKEDSRSVAEFCGMVAILIEPRGKLDGLAKQIDDNTRGAIGRLRTSKLFKDMKAGDLLAMPFPTGLEAESLILVKLPRNASRSETRKAGAALGGLKKSCDVLAVCGYRKFPAEFAQGFTLRDYEFSIHKSAKKSKSSDPRKIDILVSDPDAASRAYAPLGACVAGVFTTRDLVEEPSNLLGTEEFAERIEKLEEEGLRVLILDEDELRRIGMRTLLAVGQGSARPPKVAVIEWNNGKGRPLALVGKGVVFDTGGISLKPAKGMELMTMDMAGAGVVVGAMRTLALRNAQANVVGLVGLVENMPGSEAQRPGDVVTSLKGDTIEVINTDAEGRLVLADVLWYAQQRFKPAAVIDLATLTGAIIISLGYEFAGVFSNDEEFCADFLEAARQVDEKAWRQPLAASFDEMLKSNIADMRNVGGRDAGAITAAQFLQRFVSPKCPWIHIDIAGVAKCNTASGLSPKGATGWGVRTLDRLVQNRFESR